MNKKISVCIPSYNHGLYIADTIKSVLCQSFCDFEIIISDDNSTDNTVEIVKSFNDSRIKLIENKCNQGPSINANIAVQNASSEYLALIASDDMMEKTRLEKTFNFLNSNLDHAAVFTHVQTIDPTNTPIHHEMMNVFNNSFSEEGEILNRFFYKGNFLCAPSCLIKKSVLQKLGGFKPCLWQLQDFDMWIKILISGHKIGLIKEKLTSYRISNNLSACEGGDDSRFLSRIFFETEKVLKNFLQIKSLEDLKKIFPDLQKKYGVLNSDYIPYYLAQEALIIAEKFKQKNLFYSASYRKFAVDILYNLINSDELRIGLEKDLNFTIRDFLKLVSQDHAIEKIFEYESLIKKSFFGADQDLNLTNNQSKVYRNYIKKLIQGPHYKKSFFKKMLNSCKKRTIIIKHLFRSK